MSSGESRYSVVSDRTSGTFVTRYYSSSSQDLSLALASPPLKAVSVERIESTSGDVPSWADSPEDYVALIWGNYSTTSLSPTWRACFGESTQDRTFSMEINTQGTWVSTGHTVEKSTEGCDGSDLLVEVILNELSVLSMESNSTCNAIRVVGSPIGTYSKYTDEFCVYIN